MANGAIPIPAGAQLVPLDQAQGGTVPIPPGATLQPLDQQAPQPPGFFKRLTQSLGIPTSQQELQAAQPSLAEMIGGPAVTAGKMAYNYGKNTLQGFEDAYQEAKEGAENIGAGRPLLPNLIGKGFYPGVKAGINAVPFIGPAINTAGEDIASGNYSGGAGGLTGVVGQVALPYALEKGRGLSIPTPKNLKASASDAFNAVSNSAGSNPVAVEGAGSAALGAQDLQAVGRTMPRVMQRFIQRVTAPDAPPLTYDEARRFYSAASELSANEQAGITPAMRRQLNQFKGQLGDAIKQTADNAGVGSDYAKAMDNYARASRLQKSWENVWGATKKNLLPGLLKGLGVGAGGTAVYGAYRSLTK